MTQQLELGQAYARTTDPATSKAAAESISGKTATDLEIAVVMALVKRENKAGLTTHEIAKVTGLEYGSVTPRMKPLVERGWVKDSGIRRIPEGRSKAGIVWVAV